MIGAYDQFGNDTFYWLDGTPVEAGFTYWAADEPDGGTHDLLELRDFDNWRWGDERAIGYHRPLCEFDY